MKRSDFSYTLSKSLIARYPLEKRSNSRLMILDKNKQIISHDVFSHLSEYLSAGDLLVFNNTRVVPARIRGQKPTGGRVEIMVERILGHSHARAMISASKPPKAGTFIQTDSGTEIEVLTREGEFYTIAFPSTQSIYAWLEKIGEIPLPPYLERCAEPSDMERYQTIFAQQPGAVAAPTAGLHFDAELKKILMEKGIEFSEITLHVGAGTFLPMRTETLSEHRMHAEWLDVPDSICQKIRHTKQQGKKVIAVGTTTVRSLETAALHGKIAAFQGETDIFIYPGFNFKVVDAMLTNFHLPESTLLMLVSAFAGREFVLKAYQEAVQAQYRFFSFGDAMLLF